MSDEIFREIIIDHSRQPRRHGHLEHPSHHGDGDNPLCGDKISLDLSIDDQGLIIDAAINAVGCAISTASASLMAQQLVGLSRAQATALFNQVHEMLVQSETGGDLEALGELAALQVVKRYPMRVKCATLCWHVLKHTLDSSAAPVSTE
jgi:nitrogen fixation NifU-like protein